jgi:A/G-specific adenine glycosylase
VIARIESERNDALLTWYAASGRDLPWRHDRDPYRVLVSEVMLQQTQARRVVPYYERFIARFPTSAVLAEARLADVLTEWSGLGYNQRATRLRDAARVVAVEGWPRSTADLQNLPGVGPYTAAAVASFAFGAPVAAVDTNMRRVLSRWHGEPLDGDGLRSVAASDLAEPSADWNQAVMDLGSAVCRPRQPCCSDCPVVSWCTGPEIYVPRQRQARFEGSARQLRGSVVRAVVRKPASLDELRLETGFSTEEIELAVEDLRGEGLIDQEPDGRFTIPD